MNIGILALQGNYCQHKNILDSIGIENKYVRYPYELDSCHGLIIPGGESTAISKQIDNNNLRESLKIFSINKSILGTCAGMILLSSSPAEKNMAPLNIMNFKVKRNAWGRQIYSFSKKIKLNIGKEHFIDATFIRAPKIINMDSKLKVLGLLNDDPVLISDEKHVASSFHPEIGGNPIIHNYFIRSIIG